MILGSTSSGQETGATEEEEAGASEPQTALSEPQRRRGERPGQRSPNAVWHTVHSDTDMSPLPLAFSEPVGPALPESNTAFDCFSRVINQSIVESLVEETNK